jgi:hypothetical protein
MMPAPAINNLYNLNVLDRLLAFFAASTGPRIIGETFYQGDNNPHFYFVDSGTGSNSNDGADVRTPFATLEEAFDHVSPNRGDVIFILPGHAESLTATLSLDVAGVSVVGLGSGVARPTFVVGDAAGEAINLTAASIHIENCIFICGTDQQTWIMGVAASDCTILNCEFREVVTTKQPLICLDIGAGAAANVADRTRVLGCYFNCPTAGDGDSGIELSEVNDRVEIGFCTAWGDWDDACIHNPTAKVLTNLFIHDCVLSNLLTGQHSIELVSACTGMLARNLYGNDMTQATGVDPGSCRSYECYHDDTIDVSGILAPVAT